MRHDILFSLLLAVALTVPVVLARAATPGGVIAGFLHAAWFAWEGGIAVVLAFVALVALGVAATRTGRRRKEALGAAQEAGGRRATRHVVANATPAALFLLGGVLVPDAAGLLRLAACSALAGSLADTVAGELGMLSPETPRMMLVGAPVRRGAGGGMTLAGLAASCAAAAVVAGLVRGFGEVAFWPVLAGGIAGSLCDSVLGATAERAGLIGNEGVNFLASLCAGAAGLACGWIAVP